MGIRYFDKFIKAECRNYWSALEDDFRTWLRKGTLSADHKTSNRSTTGQMSIPL